jgi:hypothetical protein
VSIIACSTAEEQGWRIVVARKRVLSRLTAKPELGLAAVPEINRL